MAIAGSLTYDTSIDTKGFSRGIQNINDTARSGASTFKSIIAALGIAQLVESGINLIKSSVSDAVSRVDTLRNYPKVMSNLGIATEDAEKSVEKLSEKLTGLPTTLDDATIAVQRLTSKNGDIEKSTDYFLALNDAIIAGGASSEIQSSAIEQLSQAYARGKPDMMEWRTLMVAMPAQLTQVAEAMGYVSADALGEDLRNGNVSMEEFMDTLVELDQNGVGHFQSFSEQAQNAVGGIQTSITNMKTAVARGVGEVIEAIDTILESKGLGGISTVISNIGKGLEGGLKDFADILIGLFTDFDGTLEKLIDTAKEKIPEILQSMITYVRENLPVLMENLGLIVTSITNLITENIPLLIELGVTIVESLVQGIIQNMSAQQTAGHNLIFTLIDSLLANLDRLIIVGIDLILAILMGIIEAIPILLAKIPQIINDFVMALTSPEVVEKLIVAAFQLMFALAKGLIEAIPTVVLMVPRIIRSFFNSMSDRIKKTDWSSLGYNILRGILGSMLDFGQYIYNTIAKVGRKITNSIKDFFGIDSPSKLMRDQIGRWLPEGIAVGIDANTKSVMDSIDALDKEMINRMNNTIALENGRLNNSIKSNSILSNNVVLNAQITGDAIMDGTKVGRIVTPVVSKTIKVGGIR